jgi:hypothetical protein
MLLTYLPVEQAETILITLREKADASFLQKTFKELVKAGATALVTTLLTDERVDPTADQNKAIQLCAKHGHLALLELLLTDKRVNPADEENAAICLACYNGRTDVARRLLKDERVDPTINNHYLMVSVANSGYTDLVRLLLEDGRVDPGIREALACACGKQDNGEIVKLLLADKRVNPAAWDFQAYEYAVSSNDLTPLRLLVEHEAWSCAPKHRLLAEAAKYGNLAAVKFLVEEKGVDPDNEVLVTAVQTIWKGAADTIAYLLKQPGVDPAARDNVALQKYATEYRLDDRDLQIGRVFLEDGRVTASLEMVSNAVRHNEPELAEQLLCMLKRKRVSDEDEETRKKAKLA